MLSLVDRDELLHEWFVYCVDRYCKYDDKEPIKGLFWWSLRRVHDYAPGEWWGYWQYKVADYNWYLRLAKRKQKKSKKKRRR